MEAEQARWYSETFGKLVAHVEQAVLGKPEIIRLALTCLFADGHLLLEDEPGTGKTLLAKSIANTVQATQGRVRLGPEVRSEHVAGSRRDGVLEPGPLFSRILIVDRLDHATIEMQGVLQDAMDEREVTVTGTREVLDRPFMVIATVTRAQPATASVLSSALLDRFSMGLAVGHPNRENTTALLASATRNSRADEIDALITANAVAEMAQLAETVHVERVVLEYVARIAEATRGSKDIEVGVGTRGCIDLVRTAKAWAAACGRNYVLPDDVAELAGPVLAHRVILDPSAAIAGLRPLRSIERVIESMPPPHSRD